MPKKVMVFYKPLNCLSKPEFDVAHEVIIPDSWSDAEIKEWYTKRHSHINGVGIKVFDITYLDN